MSDNEKKKPPEFDAQPIETRLEIRAQHVSLKDLHAGDIIFTAGAFSGGMPIPVTKEHGGAIVFKLGDNTEVLRFAPDGKVYLRGELVHDNLEAWTGMHEWLVAATIFIPGDAVLGKPN